MPPFKKVPQTDAIFEHVNQAHQEAKQDPGILRASLDAKMAVPLGPFSRGGHNRIPTKAWDHDFKPNGRLTPFGLFLPQHDLLDLFFTASKVTSDFIVDLLTDWWRSNKDRFGLIHTLMLDLDNGPENHGGRSQFLRRLVEFAKEFQITVRLVYYPPYHSKYNPIERCWGVLENYWRGALLETEAAVLGYAANMTWKGQHPTITRTQAEYKKGVRLTRPERAIIETFLERTPGLEKWALTIRPPKPDQRIL